MAEEDSKKSDTENQISESDADYNDDVQDEINTDISTPEPVCEPERPGNSTDGIDVDLTALSSTMVCSEVYNMLLSPDDYIGKTVKTEE